MFNSRLKQFFIIGFSVLPYGTFTNGDPVLTAEYERLCKADNRPSYYYPSIEYYPMIAGVLNRNTQEILCAAILVDTRYMLLSEHCITLNTKEVDLVFIMGTNHSFAADVQEIDVDRRRFVNDRHGVVLVPLKREPTFSNKVEVAFLHKFDTEPEEMNCVIVGWTRKLIEKQEIYPGEWVLFVQSVKLLTAVVCDGYNLDPLTLCTGYPGQKYICANGTTNILMCDHRLAAISQAPYDCPTEDFPGIYIMIETMWLLKILDGTVTIEPNFSVIIASILIKAFCLDDPSY